MGDQPESPQPEPSIARGTALDVMVVMQFRPAWEMQAYLRFARLPYRVENTRYAGSAATGLFPALMDGQFVLPSEDTAGHVARRRADLDSSLGAKEKAEARAFKVLVREGLQPLLRVMRYRGDEGEIRHTVHPPMKKALPWPLTWWSPAAEDRRSRRESAVRGLDGLSKDALIGRAKEMYAALDLRLGKSGGAFFFGSGPTSLDACVFGHLAEAWTLAGLLDLLPAFDNLSRFFRLVCEDYFRPGSFPPAGEQETQEPPDGTIDGGSAAVAEGGERDRDFAGSCGGAALRLAMLRADYVNSLNAFNQLPGCALCSEVPYVEDPYPPRPIVNAGIAPPVLAGSMPGAEPAGAAAAAVAGEETKPAPGDTLPLKYTVVSTAVFLLLSTILSQIG
eukprot:g9465.t1